MLYAGFIVATALCGLAPNYALLLAARIVAGAFGGVIGGLVLAIVADLVPFARRATATAIVAASFSLAAVAGVPAALWIAAHFTWRTPFLALAALSIAVGLVAARLVPPLARPSRACHAPPSGRAAARDLRRAATTCARSRSRSTLMFAGFTVIPFIAPYNVANVGLAETDLPIMYFAGGLATLVTSPLIGRLADRYGKKRRVRHRRRAVDRADPDHDAPDRRCRSPVVIACAVLFFVLVTGRFGPGWRSSPAASRRALRGSFMSFNASIQQLGSGLAALTAGFIIGRAPDGRLTATGSSAGSPRRCTLARHLARPPDQDRRRHAARRRAGIAAAPRPNE